MVVNCLSNMRVLSIFQSKSQLGSGMDSYSDLNKFLGSDILQGTNFLYRELSSSSDIALQCKNCLVETTKKMVTSVAFFQKLQLR